MTAAPIPPLEFQQLQPVLLWDGVAWVPGGGATGAELVFPTGRRLPLRQFCPVATLTLAIRVPHAQLLLVGARRLQALPGLSLRFWVGVGYRRLGAVLAWWQYREAGLKS